MSTYAVPASVGQGEDRLVVVRAWPGPLTAQGTRLLVEGTDGAGRVRAARLDLAPAAGGWRPAGLRVAAPGRDERLPDLEGAAVGGDVVVHRYGRRAVVRRADRFVKVVRPGRAEQVATRAAQGHRLAAAAGFGAPAVLATSAGRVDFTVLPGRSLHELGRQATDEQWRRWWDAWSERWPGLTRAAVEAGADHDLALPAYRREDEVETLRGWVEKALAFGVLGEADALRRRTDRVAAGLLDGPPAPLGVSHRDLHDKQLLARGDELDLLDFDTAALAEPALDLANLAVHARLRVAQGWWPEDRSAVVRAAVHRAACELGVDGERVAAYAAATRLRLACVYAFRPRYRDLAVTWGREPDEKTLTRVSSPAQIERGAWET